MSDHMQPVPITNLTSSPKRFFGPKKKGIPGAQYEVPAGECVELPAEVWDRYKDRPDIQAVLGTQLKVGRLSQEDLDNLPNEGQAALLRAQREELIAERERFEELKEQAIRELAEKEAGVESMKRQLEAEREALRQERAALQAEHASIVEDGDDDEGGDEE